MKTNAKTYARKRGGNANSKTSIPFFISLQNRCYFLRVFQTSEDSNGKFSIASWGKSPGDEAGLTGSRDRQKIKDFLLRLSSEPAPRAPVSRLPSVAWITRKKPEKGPFLQAIFFVDYSDAILIDLHVTVFDAILTSRQTRAKLQCLYENLMSNYFPRTAFLKKISIVNQSFTPKDSTENNWGRYMP